MICCYSHFLFIRDFECLLLSGLIFLLAQGLCYLVVRLKHQFVEIYLQINKRFACLGSHQYFSFFVLFSSQRFLSCYNYHLLPLLLYDSDYLGETIHFTTNTFLCKSGGFYERRFVWKIISSKPSNSLTLIIMAFWHLCWATWDWFHLYGWLHFLLYPADLSFKQLLWPPLVNSIPD